MTALEMDEVVWFEQRDFGELQEYSKQQGQARTDATRLEMAGITPRAVFDWMNRRAALPYVDDFSSFFNLLVTLYRPSVAHSSDVMTEWTLPRHT